MFVTTRGIVLREVKYKEADKILTVLTDTEGKLTVSARGARRKGCKYSAATQLLTLSEMTLFGGRGRWSMNEAETIEQFLGLRDDIEKLALASYIAETLEVGSDADSPNPQLLQCGLNSLYALSRDLRSTKQIKAAFELRLMCILGYEPDVSQCCVCGKDTPDEPMLSLEGGIVHCKKCAVSGGRSLPLCVNSLAAARHIVNSPAKRLFAFTLGEPALSRLGDAAESFLLYHMGRGFGSLDYYNSFK